MTSAIFSSPCNIFFLPYHFPWFTWPPPWTTLIHMFFKSRNITTITKSRKEKNVTWPELYHYWYQMVQLSKKYWGNVLCTSVHLGFSFAFLNENEILLLLTRYFSFKTLIFFGEATNHVWNLIKSSSFSFFSSKDQKSHPRNVQSQTENVGEEIPLQFGKKLQKYFLQENNFIKPVFLHH